MQSIRKFFLPVCMAFALQYGYAQVSQPVQQLQNYSKENTPYGYSPKLNYLTLLPKGNLHYLFPFYHAFKDEEKFKNIYTARLYYEELSQYFAFAGDYQTALQYLVRSYDSVNDDTRRKIFKTVEGMRAISVHVDARRYIHFRARNERVVMINEAHDKPLHRAFTLSLLAGLYQEGFRYLAMEMLNNYPGHSLTRVNTRTGYYTGEPVAGELVRGALALGYTLVSAEDTAAAAIIPTVSGIPCRP